MFLFKYWIIYIIAFNWIYKSYLSKECIMDLKHYKQADYKKFNIKNDNPVNDKFLGLKEIKNLLKKGNTVILSSFTDYSLISDINDYYENDINIICYDENPENILNAKKLFDKKNILFFNTAFSNNSLRTNSVDLIVSYNLLGNNIKLIREVKRVLKINGHFLSYELISYNNPDNNFKKFFKNDQFNKMNQVIFGYKINYIHLKDFITDMKIIGNGNYYFSYHEIKKLQDYCDKFGFTSDVRNKILKEIYLVIISGINN